MTGAYYVLALSTGVDQVKLPLAMLLVFGSAKLLDEIFERLKRPGIVGQIVAGVLLGPSVLGWLAPDNFFVPSPNWASCSFSSRWDWR